MTEFGPNGAVVSPLGSAGSKPAPNGGRGKIERVRLAVLLCGLVSSLAVALAGMVGLVALGIVQGLAGAESLGQSDNPFLTGMILTLGLSVLNWVAFFLTIPAAWIVLALSLGRFPHRGIVAGGAYTRWGAIWGALIVSAFAVPLSMFLNSQFGLDAAGRAAGSLAASAFSGGLGGAATGLLFVLIVRPAEQVRRIAVDVF